MIQRDIYEIIVVTHDKGDIIASERRVATSSEAAIAKVDIGKVCKEYSKKEDFGLELTVDDVEYVILRLGSLRPVQEVTEGKVSKF